MKTSFVTNPDFKKIRLLFLDVDGVLNSRKTVVFAKRWPDCYDEHHLPYKKEFLRHADAFDPFTTKLVNRLCEVTETFIVISSSWRKCYTGLDTTIQLFTEIGIDPRLIIGRTDEIYTPEVCRGAQIRRFIEMFKRSHDDRKYLVDKGLLLPNFAVEGEVVIDSYVIVDDMDGEEVFADQKKHLVKTDDYEGLTLRDTLKAGSILIGNDFFGVKNLQTGNTGFHFKN